jgi:biopolymer transport protein TolQ
MHEMNKLQKGMGILATTANVSPLIGLLGTVWGIMYSFINIGERGSVSIDVVAPGIAEALITTLAGLCVAIPAMVGHNFLSVWINNCMDIIDRISEYAISLFIEESKP